MLNRRDLLLHLPARSRSSNKSKSVRHRRNQNRSDLLRPNHHHKVAERAEARSHNLKPQNGT